METAQPTGTVFIECCTKCSTHTWCTRHDQQKYHSVFQAVSNAILTASPGLNVVLNAVPSHLTPLRKDNPDNKYYDTLAKKCIYFPELGAFEVRYENILIFSKHESQCWPEPQELAQLICKVKDEKQKIGNLEKYCRFTEARGSQSPPPLTEQPIDKDLINILRVRQPQSLAEHENLKFLKPKKKPLKNRTFQQNFKNVEQELAEQEVQRIQDLHFEHEPESNNKSPQIDKPSQASAKQSTSKKCILVFNSTLNKEPSEPERRTSVGRRQPSNFVQCMDQRETFYGKSQPKPTPIMNLSLTDHFKMYRSQSKKNPAQEHISDNFRKLRKDISVLSSQNENKRQELIHLGAAPIKVPELLNESKYKSNEILMKLPEFVRKKPLGNNTSLNASGNSNFIGDQLVNSAGNPTIKNMNEERQMIIRLDNIEEEAHNLSEEPNDRSNEKMRRTGLGIIREWDKQLERLEDRFERFQQKVQIIKQKKIEFDNEQLSIDPTLQKDNIFGTQTFSEGKQRTSLGDLDKNFLASCIPLLNTLQNGSKEQKPPKHVTEDYFGIGEEEKNKKLKRIYGRKRTNHKEPQMDDSQVRRSLIKFEQEDSDKDLSFPAKHSMEETEKNELSRMENNFSDLPYQPSTKKAKLEKQRQVTLNMQKTSYQPTKEFFNKEKLQSHLRKTLDNTPLRPVHKGDGRDAKPSPPRAELYKPAISNKHPAHEQTQQRVFSYSIKKAETAQTEKRETQKRQPGDQDPSKNSPSIRTRNVKDLEPLIENNTTNKGTQKVDNNNSAINRANSNSKFKVHKKNMSVNGSPVKVNPTPKNVDTKQEAPEDDGGSEGRQVEQEQYESEPEMQVEVEPASSRKAPQILVRQDRSKHELTSPANRKREAEKKPVQNRMNCTDSKIVTPNNNSSVHNRLSQPKSSQVEVSKEKDKTPILNGAKQRQNEQNSKPKSQLLSTQSKGFRNQHDSAIEKNNSTLTVRKNVAKASENRHSNQKAQNEKEPSQLADNQEDNEEPQSGVVQAQHTEESDENEEEEHAFQSGEAENQQQDAFVEEKQAKDECSYKDLQKEPTRKEAVLKPQKNNLPKQTTSTRKPVQKFSHKSQIPKAVDGSAKKSTVEKAAVVPKNNEPKPVDRVQEAAVPESKSTTQNNKPIREQVTQKQKKNKESKNRKQLTSKQEQVTQKTQPNEKVSHINRFKEAEAENRSANMSEEDQSKNEDNQEHKVEQSQEDQNTNQHPEADSSDQVKMDAQQEPVGETNATKTVTKSDSSKKEKQLNKLSEQSQKRTVDKKPKEVPAAEAKKDASEHRSASKQKQPKQPSEKGTELQPKQAQPKFKAEQKKKLGTPNNTVVKTQKSDTKANLVREDSNRRDAVSTQKDSKKAKREETSSEVAKVVVAEPVEDGPTLTNEKEEQQENEGHAEADSENQSIHDSQKEEEDNEAELPDDIEDHHKSQVEGPKLTDQIDSHKPAVQKPAKVDKPTKPIQDLTIPKQLSENQTKRENDKAKSSNSKQRSVQKGQLAKKAEEEKPKKVGTVNSDKKQITRAFRNNPKTEKAEKIGKTVEKQHQDGKEKPQAEKPLKDKPETEEKHGIKEEESCYSDEDKINEGEGEGAILAEPTAVHDQITSTEANVIESDPNNAYKQINAGDLKSTRKGKQMQGSKPSKEKKLIVPNDTKKELKAQAVQKEDKPTQKGVQENSKSLEPAQTKKTGAQNGTDQKTEAKQVVQKKASEPKLKEKKDSQDKENKPDKQMQNAEVAEEQQFDKDSAQQESDHEDAEACEDEFQDTKVDAHNGEVNEETEFQHPLAHEMGSEPAVAASAQKKSQKGQKVDKTMNPPVKKDKQKKPQQSGKNSKPESKVGVNQKVTSPSVDQTNRQVEVRQGSNPENAQLGIQNPKEVENGIDFVQDEESSKDEVLKSADLGEQEKPSIETKTEDIGKRLNEQESSTVKTELKKNETKREEGQKKVRDTKKQKPKQTVVASEQDRPSFSKQPVDSGKQTLQTVNQQQIGEADPSNVAKEVISYEDGPRDREAAVDNQISKVGEESSSIELLAKNSLEQSSVKVSSKGKVDPKCREKSEETNLPLSEKASGHVEEQVIEPDANPPPAIKSEEKQQIPVRKISDKSPVVSPSLTKQTRPQGGSARKQSDKDSVRNPTLQTQSKKGKESQGKTKSISKASVDSAIGPKLENKKFPQPPDETKHAKSKSVKKGVPLTPAVNQKIAKLEEVNSDNKTREDKGEKMVESKGVAKKVHKQVPSIVETCEIGVQKESGVDCQVQAGDYNRSSVYSNHRPQSNLASNNFLTPTPYSRSGHSAERRNHMKSPVSDMNAGDFEFEGPEDNQKRASILQSIYFHEAEQAKIYPEMCSLVDSKKPFIDQQFSEAEALKGLEGYKYERITSILPECPLFELPIDCDKLTISSGSNSSLYAVLKILSEKADYLITRLFENNSPAGMQGVWLCCQSAWRSIVIDDFIPLHKRTGKPAFLNSNGTVQYYSGQFTWPLLIEKAIAKALGGYAYLSGLSVCSAFKMLTGSNYLIFRVKEDPSQNQRLLNYLSECEKKNFIVQAQRYPQKDNSQQQPESPQIFHVVGMQTINSNTFAKLDNKDRLLSLRTNDEPFWVKLDSFCEQFKFVNVLQLRQNYLHSYIHVEIKQNSFTVVEVSVPAVSSGSICMEHLVEAPPLTKTILYREEENNLLRLVGQACQKNKQHVFFDCQLLKGRYYLFLESGKQYSAAHLSYFGEETIRYKVVDHIDTDTMRNGNNEYVPVQGRQSRRQASSSFPRTLNFSIGSDPNSSKYGGGFGDSKKSRQERRVQLIRKQFVDYLLSSRGNQ